MTTNTSGSADRDDDSGLDYDAPWMQVAQRHYDPDDDRELTTAIVFAIADAEGVSPTDVKSPPLYDVVDVSAVEDAFFGTDTRSGPRNGTGTVEFRYTDYRVKIRSDGWVQIYETAETEMP